MDITRPTDAATPLPVDLFIGSTGINNRLNPLSLKAEEMSACENFVIDDAGLPATRSGSILAQAGIFHSLPQEPDVPYVAQNRMPQLDSAIYHVASDLSLTGIRSGLTYDARISYCPFADKVYYSNGYELGVLTGTRSDYWVKGDVAEADRRILSGPVAGSHLATLDGRMFIVEGNVVWISELFRFDLYEMSRNFMKFTADVIMIRAVENGLYVSTTEMVYFVSGVYPDEIKRKIVSSKPAIEWSDVSEKIESSEFKLTTPTLCAMWVSQEGAIVGLPGGEIIKLNNEKVKYPGSFVQGASILYEHSFIHSLV